MANRIILNEVSYHGFGAIESIPDEVEKNKFKKAFICTDPGLIKAGAAKKITDVLDKANLEYLIFSDVQQNPTIENVKAGVEKFKESGADYIIAIGGGSAMDCAKAVAIIINNPEFSDVRSLEGVADTKNKCVPIIAVATTAGTAAEVTINYVITDVEKNRKFVCVDPHDMPIVAIVDPGMMMTMPKELTAATGLDALTHAIEGFTTKAAWEMTDMFHLKAIELIAKYLRKAVENDEEAKEKMALASYLAGMGFSNVGLGIVHSMAHPLGAFYGTPHGVANAIILPTVMEYNAEYTGEKFREIAKAFGINHTKRIFSDLIKYNKVIRPYIGIAGTTISDTILKQFPNSKSVKGIYIRNIGQNSPAEKAGLKIGDIITSFDNKPVSNMFDIDLIKNNHNIGDKVNIEIYRSGEKINTTIELSESNN